MKAAILKAFGSPLSIETVPEPVLGTGEVIVDVVATRVLSYANEVFSGERKYALDLPVIPGPGGIGRVRALGPDATRLALGDWVFCDPTVRSRDTAIAPDITLQAWSARDAGGMKLQRFFRDGSFAEQMRVPTENAKPIGPLDRKAAMQWCALGTLLVPYGGFLAAHLEPGETVLVSGATGNFGSAAVAVALAMGAGRVVAPGRNETVLADLDGHPAAIGTGHRRARCHHGRAALRPGRADGRRRHARRGGTRPALSLDHAQLHHPSRRLDVSAGRDTPPGSADPVGAARHQPVRGGELWSRRRQ